MNLQYCLLLVIFQLTTIPQINFVCGGGGALEERLSSSLSTQYHPPHPPQHYQQQQHYHQQHHHPQQHHPSSSAGTGGGGGAVDNSANLYTSLSSNAVTTGSGQLDHHKNSYNLLSEAMSQAVSHEFSSLGSGSADGACHAEDLDCFNVHDRLGMEAIRSLHRQLDDDDNGNIDLSESDDFLREELKYDSGYEKRQKAFHYNDDMHISVKELWEAWLRSEVHNWTIEQTTDWLAQSVQLPQYVDLFKQHKVTGATLPRLAVNNMHYVSNVLGIKDPIHKQKIALKAMDVVLFGPPRETGTRWKDYILVTLLLSAIIGCWYAYQQNKNAKRHLKRMAQDMEGLQKAEQALQEMQKELELARMEQENVATEKLDLERRLKEAPTLSSSNSDLELQQLKAEIEMLRSELSRAEIELVDHCWSPPPQLQTWLQYTYEIESRHHLRKRLSAEKQLQSAREACEKLRRKRSSLVGAFVSTHGKSIDDVDRSIVEARNSLSEVTHELQERLHRWKQIELMTGFQIVNNNGISYLENILYNRNGTSNSITGKSSRARISNSTDDLDDDASVQGRPSSNNMTGNITVGNTGQDDSSVSEDGDNQSVQFYLGNNPSAPTINHLGSAPSLTNLTTIGSGSVGGSNSSSSSNNTSNNSNTNLQHQQQHYNNNINNSINNYKSRTTNLINHNSYPAFNSHESISEENRSPSVSSERSVAIPPRIKKPNQQPSGSNGNINQTFAIAATGIQPPPPPPSMPIGRQPLPPPRKQNSQQSQFNRSKSTDTFAMELYNQNYPSGKAFTNAAVGRNNIGISQISQTSSPAGVFNFNIIPSQSVPANTTAISTAANNGNAAYTTTTNSASTASFKRKNENLRHKHFPTGTAITFISKLNYGSKHHVTPNSTTNQTTSDTGKSSSSAIWFTDIVDNTVNDKHNSNTDTNTFKSSAVTSSNGTVNNGSKSGTFRNDDRCTPTNSSSTTTTAAAAVNRITTISTNTTTLCGSNIKEWPTASKFAIIKPSSYSDSQIEDTISTDSSSTGDPNDKKRRRKLRLPFSKKSIKSKLA